MKKTICNWLAMGAALVLCASCNDTWEDEQYEQYVSFKAPMDYTLGVTNIYVKYKPEGKVTYELPLIVSGSIMNEAERNVHIDIDHDTLDVVNMEHFSNRKDLYYRQLDSTFYELPKDVVDIPAGQCTALLDIDFKLSGLDLVDKWVLPLTILDDPSYNYQSHPRKNYKKAVLRVIPFNDYSGSYSASAMNVYFEGEDTNPMVENTRTTFVVDDKSIFFYAGVTEESLQERRVYKIIARFNDDKTLTLSAEDKRINLKTVGTPTYKVEEQMDATLPYLKHRYITMNMEYEYDDVTSVPGTTIGYKAKGTMTLERKINTQIPDEDQAIEWD